VTAVLTNRLGSSLPLGSEYVSLETWDDGVRRLLTLKISLCRLGGQPTVGALAKMTASHSSFIEVPSTGLQVCSCGRLSWLWLHIWFFAYVMNFLSYQWRAGMKKVMLCLFLAESGGTLTKDAAKLLVM